MLYHFNSNVPSRYHLLYAVLAASIIILSPVTLETCKDVGKMLALLFGVFAGWAIWSGMISIGFYFKHRSLAKMKSTATNRAMLKRALIETEMSEQNRVSTSEMVKKDLGPIDFESAQDKDRTP